MKETLNTNAQAVLDVVRSTHNHPTALEIYETVKTLRPHIGLASIYRILHRLVEQGYVKELGHNEDSSRYDGRVDRHDHAICTECGKLLDIPAEISLSQDNLRAVAKTVDIELSSHEVLLYGRCASCQALS